MERSESGSGRSSEIERSEQAVQVERGERSEVKGGGWSHRSGGGGVEPSKGRERSKRERSKAAEQSRQEASRQASGAEQNELSKNEWSKARGRPEQDE